MNEANASDQPANSGVPEPGLPSVQAKVAYRIFGTREAMPAIEVLLARLTSGNPYNPAGGFVFAPGDGLRRLQDALGACADYTVTGYSRAERPDLWDQVAAAERSTPTVLEEDDLALLANAKVCVVVEVELTNPESNAYIETLVHLVDAFRELQQGVVWDVHMGKIWGHNDWEQVMEAPMSPLSHIGVVELAQAPGTLFATRGLCKFASIDLELVATPDEDGDAHDLKAMLLDASEHLMHGDLLEVGETLTYESTRLAVVEAPGRDNVLRLVDAPESEEVQADGETGVPHGETGVPHGETGVPHGETGVPRLLAMLRARRKDLEGGERWRI